MMAVQTRLSLLRSRVSHSIWLAENSIFRQVWLGARRRFSATDIELAQSDFFPNSRTILIEPHRSDNFLLRESDESSQKNYPGPDLTELLRKWLTEKYDIAPQSVGTFKDLRNALSPGACVFTWVGTSTSRGRFIHLARSVFLALFLKRHKVRAFCMLPDTYYPDAALVASVLAEITGGRTVFLQSTSLEARTFGYSRPAAPVFWTWPDERLQAHRNARKTWESRADVWVCQSASVEPLRKNANESIRLVLANTQYLERESGNLEFPDYIELLGSSKILMTTNFVQSFFEKGTQAYRRTLARSTTTGRVWEAFASGCLLICNSTAVLHELGFRPNVHYLELSQVLSQYSPNGFPEDSSLAEIADKGALHFDSVVAHLRY